METVTWKVVYQYATIISMKFKQK